MESDFKDYPKNLDPKDYWGQVKRTVYGKPVSDDHIALIVAAIEQNLLFAADGSDCLLDIGCGNGALSQFFFDRIKAFHGVDYSEYLISVAKRDFEKQPDFLFEEADAAKYVAAEADPLRFTKVLIYGCFTYFTDDAAEFILKILHDKFANVSRIFIGNLPDLDKAPLFYVKGMPDAAELRDPESKIGIWRTEAEFAALAARTGWTASFQIMPDSFYAHHYRYDVTLVRGAE